MGRITGPCTISYVGGCMMPIRLVVKVEPNADAPSVELDVSSTTKTVLAGTATVDELAVARVLLSLTSTVDPPRDPNARMSTGEMRVMATGQMDGQSFDLRWTNPAITGELIQDIDSFVRREAPHLAPAPPPREPGTLPQATIAGGGSSSLTGVVIAIGLALAVGLIIWIVA